MSGADIVFPHLGSSIANLPKGITIGNFTIAYYGIIIALGMLGGLLLARWQAKRTGQNPELYMDYAIWGILFAVVGARLYYVAFSWDNYKNNLWQFTEALSERLLPLLCIAGERSTNFPCLRIRLSWD